MELYYKDLISEEASLERLVDDLMLVVQGADQFSDPALSGPQKEAITSRLQQLKAHCTRLKEHAITTAHATDKALRHHPYSSIGLAFALGFLTALLLKRQRRLLD
ncbi:MAG TPA: hypothetical protein VL361_09155 [Candidatus Limnocylindrales bacterium]|nr:hypothetical protein [Candidatus Limnocylindrales bacterium]